MNARTSLIRTAFFQALLWTIFLALSFGWNYFHEIKSTVNLANNKLETIYKRTNAFRQWISSHGGVYVKADKSLRPNPILENDSNRDLSTISGVDLTIVNTPYLLRILDQDYLTNHLDKARMVAHSLLTH